MTFWIGFGITWAALGIARGHYKLEMGDLDGERMVAAGVSCIVALCFLA